MHGPISGILLQWIDVGGFTESDSSAAPPRCPTAANPQSAVTELGYQARLDLGIWSPFAS